MSQHEVNLASNAHAADLATDLAAAPAPAAAEGEPGNPMELEFDDSDNSGLIPIALWW